MMDLETWLYAVAAFLSRAINDDSRSGKTPLSKQY